MLVIGTVELNGHLYIDETMRRPGDNFAVHLRSICQGLLDLSVAISHLLVPNFFIFSLSPLSPPLSPSTHILPSSFIYRFSSFLI